MVTYMAREALLVYFLRRSLCESKDLGCIAAAFDMRSCRTVTVLARHTFAAVFKRELRVRAVRECVHLVLVASRANLRADIVVRLWGRRRCRLRVGRVRGGAKANDTAEQREKHCVTERRPHMPPQKLLRDVCISGPGASLSELEQV